MPRRSTAGTEEIAAARPKPGLEAGAGLGYAPPVASGADMQTLQLPRGLQPGWQRAWVEGFRQALKRHRSFGLYLEACNRCGACAKVCPFYQATGDPESMPLARLEAARAFQRGFCGSGKRGISEERLLKEITPDLAFRWYAYFQQCSLCRRCASVCPLHIDIARVALLCRSILAGLGIAPRSTAQDALGIYRWGNSLGIQPEIWQQTCARAEATLKQRTGQDIRCPVDQARPEVLLIPSAADLREGAKGLMDIATIFHAAGVNWTTSSYINDAGNPGLHLGYRHLRLIARRCLEAARLLKPQIIIWADAGSGWALARALSDTLAGPWAAEEYLEVKAPLNFLEWTLHHFKRGAFHGRIDKEVHDGKILTLHDPCFAARWANLLKEPRELIRACCHFFVELPARLSGANTVCCGGGGGLGGDDFTELRLKAFRARAADLAMMQARHDIGWVVSPCGQCRLNIERGCGEMGIELNSVSVARLFSQSLYPDQNTGGA